MVSPNYKFVDQAVAAGAAFLPAVTTGVFADKKPVCLALAITGAAGTVQFLGGSVTSQTFNTAGGPIVLPYNPVGWFELAPAGTAVTVTVATATQGISLVWGWR